MLDLFYRGGIMMYPLALSSIIALAFVLERFIFLRKKKILVPEILSVVENFSSPKDIDLARSICAKNSGPLSNVIRIGLDNYELTRDEIKELLEDQGRQEIRTLQRGLITLEIIAAIAPLMGLLGTVLGMVRVFDVIKDQGVGQTAALSGGISEALITTVAGLFIGIPALVAYYYFTHKAENLILDIEKYTNQIIHKIDKINKGRPHE
jgi:biopolymer transport protein ExbB